MLKIKDNVDLKELEKYKFNYNADKKQYYFNIDSEEILIVVEGNRHIRLYIDDEYYCCYTEFNTFDLLYDLIKSDLVEKV